MATIFWLGRDLRVRDNPALAAAVKRGRPVLPLFILDDEDAGRWAAGRASRWWLHNSLAALSEDLEGLGSRLLLRRGPAEQCLEQIIRETGATAIYWNRRYEPWAIQRNEKIKKQFNTQGLEAKSFSAALLHEPWTINTQNGGPYRVFTPFWRAVRTKEVEPAAPTPTYLPPPAIYPPSDRLEEWHLCPTKPNWAKHFHEHWRPGEKAALQKLDHFTEKAIANYDATRNQPGIQGTSRLSPHLHFGEIGPRQVWGVATSRAMAYWNDPMHAGVEQFLSEIVWREFSYHLLFHFPSLPDQPLRAEFKNFPWVNKPADLEAWQHGLTGYPILDAGLRELWHSGWMHNRVRMIVASFLIKDLLVDWRQGEAWFWDTLVDADLASNAASWQWVAGCGTDASPYFRIFNPTTQGMRFDVNGDYIRRWLPELARLPTPFLHKPEAASPLELADAGVTLGKTYPHPIVDHALARQGAIAAFTSLKTVT